MLLIVSFYIFIEKYLYNIFNMTIETFINNMNEHLSDFEIWNKIIDSGLNFVIAIIAFFGTTTGLSILKEWKNKRDLKKSRKEIYQEHLNNVEVYRKLTELRTSTNFDRILLFEGKNTDTAGKPLTSYNIKCVQASCNNYKKETEAINKFVNFKPDPHYRSILATITDPEGEEIIKLETNTLPQGRLKEIYEANEIKDSIVFLIGVTKKYHLIYGSASQYDSNKEKINNNDINELKITIDYLKKFL